MAKDKIATERANLYLTVEARELLARLAPSPKKRGEYLSGLIKRAAQEAGLVAVVPASLEERIAVLERELNRLKADISPRR